MKGVIPLVAANELAKAISNPEARHFLESLVSAIKNIDLVRPRFGEFIVLKGHHDMIPLRVGAVDGFIRLSEWWAGWSVKWYSIDEKMQFPFIEGPSIDEHKARQYFEMLKSDIQNARKASSTPTRSETTRRRKSKS